MGLTIHYNLGMSEHTGVTLDRREERLTVGALVDSLRQRAMDMGFQHCDDKVIHLVGEECKFERDPEPGYDESLRWLLIQAGEYVEVGPGSNGGHISTECVPVEIFAFNCWPGYGCEPMNIGLCRYPSRILYEGRSIHTRLSGWRWSSFCKTQYASEIGVGHFLRCHNLVCAMLDHAKSLGFTVDVSDEGGYYKDRDLGKLAKEVGQWNQMIAGMVGALKDAGCEGESPITKFSDFEHLEAKGREGGGAHAEVAKLAAHLATVGDSEVKTFLAEQERQKNKDSA